MLSPIPVALDQCSPSSSSCSPLSSSFSSSNASSESAHQRQIVASQRRRTTDDGGEGWRRMRTTAATVSGTGGVMAILQRAFCAHFSPLMNTSSTTQYRTVLTRESQDSGLELDEMDKERERRRESKGTRGEKELAREREEEENGEEEKKTEEEEGEGEGERAADSQSRIEIDQQEATNNKKRRSLGRLLSSLVTASCSPSPARHSTGSFPMFSFPLSPHSPYSASASPFASPIAQLSHANAVLVQDNERLGQRVEELELMLRDHVAHLNSIYHTLHRLHGFQALQLPDGELVHLSRFQGFPLHFIREDGPWTDQQQTAADQQPTKEQLIGQARRAFVQQQQQRQQRTPENQSLSSAGGGGSSSSFASSSVSDSASVDPTELSQAMLRRLCIRPAVATSDSGDEMQAFMDWLKAGGGADQTATTATVAGDSPCNGDNGKALAARAHRMVALRELGRAAVHSSADSGSGPATESAATERLATAAVTAATVVPIPHRTHRQPPVYSVMSKSQRIRTQYPSLSSRRRSPLPSSPAPASASSASGGHHNHGGICGSGSASAGMDAERSPRRGGIGITNMGRMGARASDAYKTVPRRNLI